MPDPEPQPKPGRSRQEEGGIIAASGRAFRIVAWIVTVLVALAVSAKPLYREIRRHRALAAARAALRLEHEQQDREAGRQLKVALDLAPLEPEVLRTAAEFSTRLGSPSSVRYWELLASTGAATRQDQLAACEEALRIQRLDFATDLIQALQKSAPEDLDTQHLTIRLLQARRDSAGALRLAESVYQKHPGDPRSQFVLGTLRLGSPKAAGRSHGRGLLWTLALGSSPFRDDAVEALIPEPELNRAEIELLLKSLRAQTPPSLRTRLQIADLRLRLDPTIREALGAELRESIATGTVLGDRQRIAAWLGRNGLAETALAVVPLDLARTNGVLLGIRLEALASLDRWSEIEHLVGGDQPDLDNSIASLFRAELATRKEQRDQAEVWFRSAIAACTNRVDQLVIIARRADRAGHTSVAVDALIRLMDSPRFAVSAARETLAMLRHHDDFQASRRVVARLAEVLPGDPAVATELAYHKLVLAEDLEVTRERLLALRAEHPDESEVRLALAFANLRTRRPDEALTLIESPGWDWRKAPPRWQAVYAAVLAGNQQRGAARDVATHVNQKSLKAEERELIRGLL